jgi:branched-chain amino acid transport system ATP-binding protein
MEKAAILSTTDLSMYFGGLAALKNLTVTVRQGEIHGLIGPNGAGKTTFTNVVSGFLKPTEGNIVFDGANISGLSPHVIVGMGLSRTFQRAQVFPKMTCLQNVMVGRHSRLKTGFLGTMLRPPFVRSGEEEETRNRALELLDRLGLSASADRMATDLVWVECQLLQIARSLMNEPKLLILDEPTAGMGTEESDIIAGIIRQVRDSGVTIILISHDVHLVMDNADWVTVINFGEKICEEVPESVQCDAKVLEAYLGSE